MSTWGSELWDRYSCVLSHVTRGGDEVSSVFAKFVKERGDLEKEYAKSIRKLVIKYQQKAENKQGNETTQSKGFRLVLQEMGFQAGQHEIVAETFLEKLQQEVQKKAKELTKKTKSNLKEAKRISEEINKMYKDLDKAKTKYQKSFVDWESAKNNYSRANEDGTISRNEIAKLKSFSDSRCAQCDDYKGVYASQLMKTNKYQAEYYYKELPGVLNSLQNIEIDRIDYLKHVMEQCVAAEKHVAPILARCRQDMESIIQNINPEADSHILVERLKTGEVPPEDLAFEEMTCGTEVKFGTLRRRKSKLKLNKSVEKDDNFQKKRELEKKIHDAEAEIDQDKKEISALEVMILSYENNPKFGDSKKFQSELDSAVYSMKVKESDLHSIKTQLKDLNCKLEEKKEESLPSYLTTPLTIRKIENSPGGNRSHSIQSGSAGYGTLSNYSNSDRGSERLENNEHEDFSDEKTDTVVALYDYTGDCIESSIDMEVGEEFIVTEGDEGGWTRVKRKNIVSEECEGYVPTAYLQWL